MRFYSPRIGTECAAFKLLVSSRVFFRKSRKVANRCCLHVVGASVLIETELKFTLIDLFRLLQSRMDLHSHAIDKLIVRN